LPENDADSKFAIEYLNEFKKQLLNEYFRMVIRGDGDWHKNQR
jgi:hypothetical protein